MKIIKYVMLILTAITFLPFILIFSGVKFTVDLMDDGLKRAVEQFWEGY